MKIIIELNTDSDVDRSLLSSLGLGSVAGLDTAAGAPEPVKRGPGRPKATAATETGAAAPATTAVAAAPAANGATEPAAGASGQADDALLPEIRKIMSEFAQMTTPGQSAAHLRNTLGFPSVASIPPDKRQDVIKSFQAEVDKALTA